MTVTDQSGTITREYDKRNLLVAYTDAAGNRIGYTYDANGNLILTKRPDGSTETIVRDKAGKMLSKKHGQYSVITDANGLYQMRARYYSPDLKRFVNQDVLLGTITDSQSLNRYAYTNGNPINRLDPFGLCAAMIKNLGHLVLNLLSMMLLFTPYAPLGAVLAGINAAWYFYDGDILGGLCSLGIVLGGVGGLIGGTAGLIMSGCGNLLMAGTSTWSAGQSIGKMCMDYQETGKIDPWDAVSATMNLGMAAMGTYGAAKSFASIPAMGRIKSKLESAWNARKSGEPEGTRAPTRTNDELVQEIASRAERIIGGRGSVAGTYKHTYARDLLNRYQRMYGDRGLRTETSWLDHVEVNYGTRGSVRLDVYDANTGSVFDYKFVSKPGTGLSQSQTYKILLNGPENIIVVSEVNP